jgi:hypothetical protein
MGLEKVLCRTGGLVGSLPRSRATILTQSEPLMLNLLAFECPSFLAHCSGTPPLFLVD